MNQPPKKKRATLQDVALAAGVSPMTVSRTINGHPYVTLETARKIQEAIQSLDYRPNHAARVLTGKLSRSIGLIVPDISDTFFSVVSHAVQETARAENYLVWLAASEDDLAIEVAQVETMTHHPVDGIILVPSNSRAPYLKGVAAASTPVVTVDRPIEITATDSVGVENRAGAIMAMDHLIQHGYKRIACIAANTHLLPIKDRIAGYKDSLQRSRLSYSKEVLLKSSASSRPVLTDLLTSRNRPDALFTANNASTIWVIETLKELNMKMGKDIGLVGFDDVDFFTLITPSVTAVRQPAAELGNAATRLLLQRINNEVRTPSVRVVLPVTLTIRESCGCKKSTKASSAQKPHDAAVPSK